VAETWKNELSELRERRKQLIITAAEKVFINKDLPHATIQDIASEAGVSRPTVYKYFSSIEELAFEVQMRALAPIYALIQECSNGEGTAMQRIDRFISDCIDNFNENTQHIRFSSLFDHHFQKAYPSPELEARYTAFLQQYVSLESLIEQGIQDGSLRSDLPVHNSALLLGNLLIAFLQRLAQRGEILAREQNIDIRQQLNELRRMLVAYFQA
jgi:AcrR family transcriptional regulator